MEHQTNINTTYDCQPSQNFKNYDHDDCKPTRKCWEKTRPFEGGSVPWKGTSPQQAAAARAAERAKLEADPPCVWARCSSATCPKYSCSDTYDMERFRPACKSFAERGPAPKQQWCYASEGNLLAVCGGCWSSPYDCAAPEGAFEPCAGKRAREIPLFVWSDGICYPNYGARPFPFHSEKLRPPKVQPFPKIDLPRPCVNPNRDPQHFSRCSVLLGGPNTRTKMRRLEEVIRYPARFEDKRALGFPESVWCRPLPSGGAVMEASCKPCACPLL